MKTLLIATLVFFLAGLIPIRAEDPDQPASGWWMPGLQRNAEGEIVGLAGVYPPDRDGHMRARTRHYLVQVDDWDDGVTTTFTVHLVTYTPDAYTAPLSWLDLDQTARDDLAEVYGGPVPIDMVSTTTLKAALDEQTSRVEGKLWNEMTAHLYRLYRTIMRDYVKQMRKLP